MSPLDVAFGVALGWLSAGAYLVVRSMVRAWWDAQPGMTEDEVRRWLDERRGR